MKWIAGLAAQPTVGRCEARRGAEVVLTACRQHHWSDLQATNGTVFASMDA